MNQIEEGLDEHPWVTHSQMLRQHFAVVADSKCLLWINPAQRDPLNKDLVECNRKRRVPVAHPRFDLHLAPYLVQLDLNNPTDAELLELSVQLAWEAWTEENLRRRRGQPIAGWIASNETPTTLARYWATYTHLHLHGGLSKLLRFHDPGVREWLWPILTETQQRQLLGPALCLSAINRHQQLMHQFSPPMKALKSSAPSPQSETQVRKLTLTQTQWDHVEDFAIVHAAWIECCFDTNLGKDALHTNWQTDIFPALANATEYGLNHPQDRELFAGHVLKIGAPFHTHRKMQEIWQQTRDGIAYGRALQVVLELARTDLPQYLMRA